MKHSPATIKRAQERVIAAKIKVNKAKTDKAMKAALAEFDLANHALSRLR